MTALSVMEPKSPSAGYTPSVVCSAATSAPVLPFLSMRLGCGGSGAAAGQNSPMTFEIACAERFTLFD